MESDEREVLVDAVVVNLVPVLFENIEEVFEPLDFAGFVLHAFENVGQFLTHLLLIGGLVRM